MSALVYTPSLMALREDAAFPSAVLGPVWADEKFDMAILLVGNHSLEKYPSNQAIEEYE
jgi:hypothetical protein